MVLGVPVDHKFLCCNHQCVHAMNCDHSNEDHAEDTSYKTSIADGNGHCQYSNPNVALQKMDDGLNVTDCVLSIPVLSIFRDCVGR